MMRPNAALKWSLLGAQSCEAFVTNSIVAVWTVDSDSPPEAWASLYPGPPNMSPSIVEEEGSLNLPLSPWSMPLEIEELLDHSNTVMESLESSVLSLLDRCISCMPGLSERLYCQLENCSFHTVGSLEIAKTSDLY